MEETRKTRLENFFGEAGASVILNHIDDLEQTFGSASEIIVQVMEGDLTKAKDN